MEAISILTSSRLPPCRLRGHHLPAAVASDIDAGEAERPAARLSLVLDLRIADTRHDRRVAVHPHRELVLLDVIKELAIARAQISEVLRLGVDGAVAVRDR